MDSYAMTMDNGFMTMVGCAMSMDNGLMMMVFYAMAMDNGLTVIDGWHTVAYS
ncbi:MAG: hypothetical protein K9J06_05700 [Flavobacteriales bacterium]|nr:hypothetical protein [Flavobacteriales bacterium]